MKKPLQYRDWAKRTVVLAGGKVWILEDGREPVAVGEMNDAMAKLVLGRWFGNG